MFASRLSIIDSLPSTNDAIKERIHQQTIFNQQAILALTQTRGHGQFGRQWVSPYGGLYLSYYRNDLILPANVSSFVINIAKALQEYLCATYNLQLTIKPPNDLYLQDKKCAGILVETLSSGSTIKHVIIGLGLNVNTSINSSFNEINAISLATVLGYCIQVESLAAEIVQVFDQTLEVYFVR